MRSLIIIIKREFALEGIKRELEDRITERFFLGKIIVLYGARQVGKTTLVKKILNDFKDESLYLNCDEPDIREQLIDTNSFSLKRFFGSSRLIVIDEAQRVTDIGLTLKIIADNFPDIQIIATGSSSFELSNSIIEPLTGRKFEFHLYSLSIRELSSKYTLLELKRLVEERVIMGMYPEVVMSDKFSESILREIAQSYLYKDILKFYNIRNHTALEKLLRALALQTGNLVSHTELSGILGIDKKTVESYIDILEKAFIIYNLSPYYINKRNEIKKMKKVYFYDTGIRNAIINNLNSLDLRNDLGSLWENFIINELMKNRNNDLFSVTNFFWRNQQKQEIDYIEEYNGNIHLFEMKWASDKYKIPESFKKSYKFESFDLINKDNFLDYLL